MKTCIAFSRPALALNQTKELKLLSKEEQQKANGKLEVSFKYFLKHFFQIQYFL